MKIAILNDTHCGARNSSSWMIDYQSRFYKEVFWPKIDDLGIKHIMHLGDYYDSRKSAASIEAQSSNQRHFIKPLKDRGVAMKVLVGNHDAYFKNTNRLNSISTLLEDLPYIEVIDKPCNFSDWAIDICLIPWINRENLNSVKETIKQSSAKVCMGHFEFYGFQMQKGGVPCMSDHASDPNLVSKFKLVLSGHFHTRSFRGNIAYLGSQMEFTWADCGDDKFFHIFDTDDMSVTPIRNPLTLFHKVDIDSGSEIDRELLKNKFVQFIRKDGIEDEDFQNLVREAQEVALDVKVTEKSLDKDRVEVDLESISNTPDLMKSYVKDLDTELDKQRLQGMLEELYFEAVAS